jgi:hypothetical protein
MPEQHWVNRVDQKSIEAETVRDEDVGEFHVHPLTIERAKELGLTDWALEDEKPAQLPLALDYPPEPEAIPGSIRTGMRSSAEEVIKAYKQESEALGLLNTTLSHDPRFPAFKAQVIAAFKHLGLDVNKFFV